MNRLLLAGLVAFVMAGWAAVSGQQRADVASSSGPTDGVAGISRTYCQTCHNDRSLQG